MPRPQITTTSGADVNADGQPDTGVLTFPAAASTTDVAVGFGVGDFGTSEFGV